MRLHPPGTLQPQLFRNLRLADPAAAHLNTIIQLLPTRLLIFRSGPRKAGGGQVQRIQMLLILLLVTIHQIVIRSPGAGHAAFEIGLEAGDG